MSFFSNKYPDIGEASASHHVIGIMGKQDWIASVDKKINGTPKMLRRSAGKESCCIFRVPQSLVEINEKAYQPHIVSMGPYHHGKPHLQMIQEHKWRYLSSLLARTRSHGLSFQGLFDAIEPLEQRIRECYSETIEFESRQLIEMMVLDGCFVIELFCMVENLVPRDVDDPIFSMVWIFPFLTRDLLRLENQIPNFVLETLFTILYSTRPITTTLTKLALQFFNHLIQRDEKTLQQYYSLEGNHLLGLFRESFFPVPPSEQTKRKSSPFLQLIPSAKKLRVAGIEFKPRRTHANSFLDVRFRNGVLEIPPLMIDDCMSLVFLNMVAFEQCYGHCTKHVTTYATLMGCLINSPGDAGFLSDHKIIENYFGTDEEVSRFFNNVGKDVAFDIHRNYLTELFEGVNKHYWNNWRVRWASFKHTYFDTPWSFMSALAALVLLLQTMIQSFIALYAYIHSPKL